MGPLRLSVSSCAVQEIEACVALLEKECVALSPQVGSLRVLPLHAGLGALTQRLYESNPDTGESAESPAGPEGSATGAGRAKRRRRRRRVVVTDALAEASFSVPDIRYVVDTGLQVRTVSLQASLTPTAYSSNR